MMDQDWPILQCEEPNFESTLCNLSRKYELLLPGLAELIVRAGMKLNKRVKHNDQMFGTCFYTEQTQMHLGLHRTSRYMLWAAKPPSSFEHFEQAIVNLGVTFSSFGLELWQLGPGLFPDLRCPLLQCFPGVVQWAIVAMQQCHEATLGVLPPLRQANRKAFYAFWALKDIRVTNSRHIEDRALNTECHYLSISLKGDAPNRTPDLKRAIWSGTHASV